MMMMMILLIQLQPKHQVATVLGRNV